jgi:hypothetical protein
MVGTTPVNTADAGGGLQWAIATIQIALAGPIAQRMCHRQSDEEIVAFHESGHAVMCFLLGKRFAEASIVPEQGSLGRVVYSRGKPGAEPSPPWMSRDDKVVENFSELAGVGNLEPKTADVIAENYSLVRRLAEELLVRKVISGRRGRQILLRAQRKELRRVRAMKERDRRNYEATVAAQPKIGEKP